MKKVWLTRTEPGASRQAEQLQAHGYTTLVCPVMEAIELQPPTLVQNGQCVDDPDLVQHITQTPPRMVVALSGHAVRIALKQKLLTAAQDALYIAVGAQTAALLKDVAASVAVPPQAQATSEGVLALPVMTKLSSDDVVWILAGQGGRELIAQQLLRQYAATVVKFELYQRRERLVCPDADASEIAAVLIGSQQGLQVFDRLWQDMSGALTVPVIVPSTRVAEAAREAGFTEVYTANGADTEAVLAALQDIMK